MANSEQFLNASKTVTKLLTKPSNEEMGELYGLYKQATCGNNTQSKPSMFNIEGNFKWEAWMKCKDMDVYNSEVKYITIVNSLIKKYKIIS
jgi:diazepam-binding inhibitor (GABA receptor modulating acyl-CoA-binding protein)